MTSYQVFQHVFTTVNNYQLITYKLYQHINTEINIIYF